MEAFGPILSINPLMSTFNRNKKVTQLHRLELWYYRSQTARGSISRMVLSCPLSSSRLKERGSWWSPAMPPGPVLAPALQAPYSRRGRSHGQRRRSGKPAGSHRHRSRNPRPVLARSAVTGAGLPVPAVTQRHTIQMRPVRMSGSKY